VTNDQQRAVSHEVLDVMLKYGLGEPDKGGPILLRMAVTAAVVSDLPLDDLLSEVRGLYLAAVGAVGVVQSQGGV
jgi:hypothetical protein